jgi:hypothetical protein
MFRRAVILRRVFRLIYFFVFKGNKNRFKLIDTVNSNGYENGDVSLNSSLTRDPNVSQKVYIKIFQNNNAMSGMNHGGQLKKMTSTFKNQTDLENVAKSLFKTELKIITCI